MDPLCISLVDQYLESTNSALADQFKNKYQPQKTNVELKNVLSKWKEEQLVRGLVYQHLKTIAPSLAVEFQERHWCSLETTPKHLVGDIQKVWANANTRGTVKVEAEIGGEQGQSNNGKRLGMKLNTFTSAELVRIKQAMANCEDIGTVAKEMERSYYSVSRKMTNLRQSTGFKKGKFSAEEIERMKEAVANNEDYKSVATELGRMSKSVYTRMFNKNGCTGTQRKSKGYTFEEDLRVLDKIIPRLQFQKLSSGGFLSHSVLLELSEEIQRSAESVRNHWETLLQPWLLQHYTGTTGFRIERILTSLVAEKFNDHKGIDWSQILNQHKELVGHTASSISGIYRNILSNAKEKKSDVSLQEVAEYAATVYQPGKEKKEPAAKAFHREKIILYFKKKVAELGIDVVV